MFYLSFVFISHQETWMTYALGVPELTGKGSEWV